MKTLPQIYLALLLLSWMPITLQAQQDSIRRWVETGTQHYEEGQFQDAIRAFRLARTFDGSTEAYGIDEWIEKSFNGYVELLKAAEEKARREARASEMAGLAYKLAKENPTHAVHVAAAALELNPNSKSARQQLHDIISIYPPPFYLSELPHETALAGVVFCGPDGQLATAGMDGKARIWNTSGEMLREIDAHKEGLTAIACHEPSQTLATASYDNTAKLFSFDGKWLATLSGHKGDVVDVCFSEDGNTLATASWDGTARFWNAKGENLLTIDAHDAYLTSIALSPDGQRIATGSWDNTAKLWDSKTGNPLQTLEGHGAAVADLAFMPDGALLTASWDKTARLWDVEGKLLQTFEGHDGPLMSITPAPDGKGILTASDDKQVKLWSRSGNLLQSYRRHRASVLGLATSSDGRYFASGSIDHFGAIWNFDGPQLIAMGPEGEKPEALCIAASADGKYLIAGYSDEKARIFNSEGKLLHTLSDHTYGVDAVAASPDGQYFLTGGKDGKVILWNDKGENLRLLKQYPPTKAVTDVEFTADGQKVLACSQDETASLIRLDGTEETLFSGQGDMIYSITGSPDGQYVLTTSRGNKAIVLWSVDGKEQKAIRGGSRSITDAAFAPDGQSFATPVGRGDVIIWSLEGRPVQRLTAGLNSLGSIRYSPDGKYLLSNGTGTDNVIRIHTLDGDEIQSFYHPEGAIAGVAFTRDGRWVASGGYDGSIRIFQKWNAFLENGIAPLPLQYQQEYGLVPETDKPFTENVPRNEQENELAITHYEKEMQLTDGIAANYFAAFRYSTKAAISNAPAEQAALQQQAIDRINLVFEDKKKKNSPLTEDNYSVLAQYYLQQGLWQLALGENERAMELINEARKLEAEPFIQKLALEKELLYHLLSGQYGEAQAILNAERQYVYSDQDGFPDFLFYTTGRYVDVKKGERLDFTGLLKQDIAYLQSTGLDHENLEKIKAELGNP